MFKGIRAQVIILSTLPPALIAISIGIYLNFSHASDMSTFFKDHGAATARQIGNIAKYQLLNQQLDALQSIANISLEEQALRTVCIFDNQGHVLAHSGPKLLLKDRIKTAAASSYEATTLKDGDTIAYLQPITKGNLSSETHLFDVYNPKNNHLGWIVIEYNTSQFNIARYHQSIRQNIILFVAFLLSILLGYIFAQRANQDLNQIKKAIKRFTEEGAHPHPADYSIKEFAEIAEALSLMTQKKEAEFGELRHNVEITSNDLQETIETIEVQNIELSMAQKEAMKASQIKSEFLANTSHEIRTPLNGIIGFTRILSKTPLSAQQMEYLETIQVSSEGLLTIINDILDFSKIEANKLSLDKSPIDFRKTLEEVVSLLAPSAYEKQLEVTLMIYKDVPLQLVADPTRIKQIFFNLLSNAIKFTKKGEIMIRIQLEDSSPKTAYLQCTISDTGIGMSDSQQADLFKAFHQANSTISRDYGGTGLGLSIVKTLIERMNGNIRLNSIKGKGTQVDFSLELDKQDQPQLKADKPLASFAIALVEQHEPTQLVMQHLLENHGIKVQIAATIEELKETVALFHIDAVVYGFSTTCRIEDIQHKIEAVKSMTKSPVVAMTPLSLEHLPRLHALNILHCNKPLREHVFIRTLSQALTPELVQEQSLKPTPRTFLHQKITALAVDDNSANLALLTIILEDLGITVIQASNGAEAVQKDFDNHPDIIFMDIRMPIMNGVEASEKIREHRQTPIIALTAHAMADEKKALLNSGMNDYLTKPVNEQQIKASITHWCTNNAQNTQRVPALQVVNIALCLQLAKQRPPVALEIFSLLMQSLANDIENINHLYQHKNFDALLDTVHKLHGATCYTGVESLRAACFELEDALKRNDLSTYQHNIDQLNRAANNLIKWHKTHDLEEEIKAIELVSNEAT